jgi:hypothetical protein
MISYGMRLGAWNVLQYKHIYNSSAEEIKKRNDNVVAAKITIYAESDDQYTSFITKEANQAIDHWLDYRRKCGEQISDES